MESDAVCVDSLSLAYAGTERIVALDGMSFVVRDTEFVAVLGPSGCGKTSLLHVIGGFLPATAGSVTSFGVRIKDPGAERGILFQKNSVFPWKTALGNIIYGLRCRGVAKSEAREEAVEWLQEVGLGRFGNFYPSELSGGMQQRVAIARLFASNPRVFLMDEPFRALDFQTRFEMGETLTRIWTRHGGTVLFVTHDIEEALFLADRVLVMSRRPGRIVGEFAVPTERPRETATIFDPEVVALRREIASSMENS